MATYLESSKVVTAFPAVGRTYEGAATSHLMTEDNITKITKSIYNRESFVISVDTDTSTIEFVIKGYYFKVTDESLFTMTPLYVFAKITDTINGDNFKYQYLLNIKDDSISDLDYNSEFEGLAFSSSASEFEDSDIYSLQIFDNSGEVAPTSKLYYKTNEILDGETDKNISNTFTTDNLSATNLSVDKILPDGSNKVIGSNEDSFATVYTDILESTTINTTSINANSSTITTADTNTANIATANITTDNVTTGNINTANISIGNIEEANITNKLTVAGTTTINTTTTDTTEIGNTSGNLILKGNGISLTGNSTNINTTNTLSLSGSTTNINTSSGNTTIGNTTGTLALNGSSITATGVIAGIVTNSNVAVEANYASSDHSKGTIEERLTNLGFSQTSVTPVAGDTSPRATALELTRQGNYVIGNYTNSYITRDKILNGWTGISDSIFELPINYRPIVDTTITFQIQNPSLSVASSENFSGLITLKTNGIAKVILNTPITVLSTSRNYTATINFGFEAPPRT